MSDRLEVKTPYLQTPAGTLSGRNGWLLELCEVCIKHLKRLVFALC